MSNNIYFLQQLPQITVYFQNKNFKLKMQDQFYYCQLSTLKQFLHKKLSQLSRQQTKNNTHSTQIKQYLRIRYIDADNDQIDIVHNRDLQIFVELVRQKSILSPIVLVDLENENILLSLNSQKSMKEEQEKLLKDQSQNIKRLQYRQQIQKKSNQNIYSINCHNCKQKIRSAKLNSILKPQVFYCEDCMIKTQHKSIDEITIKLQNGEQHMIRQISQLMQDQQLIFKRLNQKMSYSQQNQNLFHLFLLENQKNLQKYKDLTFQINVLDNQKSEQSRNILPNSIRLTQADVTIINQQKVVLNIIKNIRETEKQAAKKDFFKFLIIQDPNYLIDQLAHKFQMCSMLKLYSQQVKIYLNVNLALKNNDFFTNSQKLGYLRFPISEIFNQIKNIYFKNISQRSKKYCQQLVLFHGGIMNQEQFLNFKQNINQVTQIQGFISCSLDIHIAQNDFFKKGALVQIIKPKWRGLVSTSGFCLMQGISQFIYEQQVLFNIQSKFKILDAQIRNDPFGQTYYYVKLQYLQIPQIQLGSNKEEIMKSLDLNSQCLLLQNLQHLQMISKNIKNQGDCLSVQLKHEKAIFYQLFKKYMIDNYLKKIQQVSYDLSQSLILQYAKIFHKCGEIYKEVGQMAKSEINYRRSLSFINASSSKNYLKVKQQLKSQFNLNFACYSFKRKHILTVKQSNLQHQTQNKNINRMIQSTANINNAYKNPGSGTIGTVLGKQLLKTGQFLFSNLINHVKKEKPQSEPITNLFLLGLNQFVKYGEQSLKETEEQQRQQYQRTNEHKKLQMLKNEQQQLNLVSSFFAFFSLFPKIASQTSFSIEYYLNLDLNKSQKQLLQSLKIFSKKSKKHYLSIFKCYFCLFIINQHLQKFKKAQIYLKDLSAFIRTHLGQHNYFIGQLYDLQTLAIIEQSLFLIHQQKQKCEFISHQMPFKRLIQLCQESFKLKQKLFGNQHCSHNVPLNNLGMIYCQMKKYDISIQFLNLAIKISDKSELILQAQIHYKLICLKPFQVLIIIYLKFINLQSSINCQKSICKRPWIQNTKLFNYKISLTKLSIRFVLIQKMNFIKLIMKIKMRTKKWNKTLNIFSAKISFRCLIQKLQRVSELNVT